MAGQDLKNYTRIWNPILEALAKAKLSPNQYKICFALFQNTYTWHRTEARIGYRDIERDTGIKAKKVSQPFRQLVDYNVIIEVENPSFNSPGLYKFNKDLRQWDQGVLDIGEISETSLIIIAEECGGTVPMKGTPPNDGDCPQNRGEDSPLYGGEGTPHDGDTKQPPNPWDASDAGFLKKSLKKDKEITTTADTVENNKPNIYTQFENEFNRPLGPFEIESIGKWLKKFSGEVIVEALREAALLHKSNMKYINSILVRWDKDNIRTVAAVKREQEEFEKRKSKGGTVRGPTGQATGRPGSNSPGDRSPGGQGPPGKFDSIDYSKFMYKPKPGEMPDM